MNLLEVWKRRRRWYLVFEFVERTLLDDLEQNPSGLDLNTSRQYLYQILRAAAFCHQQSVRKNYVLNYVCVKPDSNLQFRKVCSIEVYEKT